MATFTLHPQLERDTFPIGELPLCRALLVNNALFPWLILVPRIGNAHEIIDLAPSDQHRLMDEIALISNVVQVTFKAEKLNIAALGNQVPQLHVHVIARFAKDAAWPNPVWGVKGEPYADAGPLLRQLRDTLPALRQKAAK